MIIKGLLKTMAAGLLLATIISCGGNKSFIDPKAMLAYGKEPNEQNMEVLSKSYSGVISKNRKSGETSPGVYSDYAVMMVKQGKRAEANGWFNKEMEAYPSSRPYVMQLKRKLIPEYQDNNSTSAADADTLAAEPDALSPTQRKAAEKRAAAVLGDTISAPEETEVSEPVDEEDVSRMSEPVEDEASQEETPEVTTPETESPKVETPETETPKEETETKQQGENQ